MGLIDGGTLSILGIGVTISIAYLRATDEEIDPLGTSIVAVAALFVLGGLNRNYEGMPSS